MTEAPMKTRRASRGSSEVHQYKETNDMDQTRHYRATTKRIPVRRVLVATLAFGALSAMLFAPDTARAATSHSTKGIVISTMKNAQQGTYLVSGTTLYTLKSSSTPCAAKCLKIWPEVLLPKGATSATAGSGVSASQLGTVKRAGGELQVTYGGKALYWFSKDKAPGQVKGIVKDTWGKWNVVVTKKATGGSGTTTTTSPGGGGIGF